MLFWLTVAGCSVLAFALLILVNVFQLVPFSGVVYIVSLVVVPLASLAALVFGVATFREYGSRSLLPLAAALITLPVAASTLGISVLASSTRQFSFQMKRAAREQVAKAIISRERSAAPAVVREIPLGFKWWLSGTGSAVFVQGKGVHAVYFDDNPIPLLYDGYYYVLEPSPAVPPRNGPHRIDPVAGDAPMFKEAPHWFNVSSD